MSNPGDRVQLIHTSDAHTALQPGTQGTVTTVDDAGTVHVRWDDGSRLGLIPSEDTWTTIAPQPPDGS